MLHEALQPVVTELGRRQRHAYDLPCPRYQGVCRLAGCGAAVEIGQRPRHRKLGSLGFEIGCVEVERRRLVADEHVAGPLLPIGYLQTVFQFRAIARHVVGRHARRLVVRIHAVGGDNVELAIDPRDDAGDGSIQAGGILRFDTLGPGEVQEALLVNVGDQIRRWRRKRQRPVAGTVAHHAGARPAEDVAVGVEDHAGQRFAQLLLYLTCLRVDPIVLSLTDPKGTVLAE